MVVVSLKYKCSSLVLDFSRFKCFPPLVKDFSIIIVIEMHPKDVIISNSLGKYQ